jgi:signal transduction histidine kinase
MPSDGGGPTVPNVPTPRPASARIARELHDVLAHGLSAIAVQAEAAQAALPRDPSQAAASVEAIRAAAHEALDDMRRLIAVTRDGSGLCERAPQPGLADLPALVAAARDDGQAVTLEVAGESRPLPASLELAAYRVVQEALENAARSAPDATVAVRVAWTPDDLELVVGDDGGPGRRVAAIRQRVRLHGGMLRAGPCRPGGYRVRAVFPVSG